MRVVFHGEKSGREREDVRDVQNQIQTVHAEPLGRIVVDIHVHGVRLNAVVFLFTLE